MNAIDEMSKSVLCLNLELPEEVAKEITRRWRNALIVLEKKDKLIENLREVIRLYEKKHKEYEADIKLLKELDELRRIRAVYEKIEPIIEAVP